MSVISKKVCLIGDFGVGKTSLIRCFVEQQFSDKYLSTVGVKISRKNLEVCVTNSDKKQTVQLLIWDLEGSNKFKNITTTYLQGASGAIIVADISRPETINNISEHIKMFLSINPQGLIIVALNKSDLLTEEKLAHLLQQYHRHSDATGLATYTTSAKTGYAVAEIFEKLVANLIQT